MNLQQLLTDLHNDDYRIRRQAIENLAKTKDKRAVSNLLTTIHDNDWSIQAAAIKALGEIGDSQAVPTLIEAVLGDDEWVAEAAATALGMIGDVRAIPALIRALFSEDLLKRFDGLLEQKSRSINSETWVLLGQSYFDISDLRCAAARALGQIGNVQALPSLITALNDAHDIYVQQAAAQALERISTPEAVLAVSIWRQKRRVEEDGSQNP